MAKDLVVLRPGLSAPVDMFNRYIVNGQQYAKSINVSVDAKCNGWTALNKGTAVARVNGIPLSPGESFSIGGNAGEAYGGMIQISILAIDTAPSVFIIQKIYL